MQAIKPSSFPRGSEWRRWDLHIHTSDSKLGASFVGVNWNEYVDELEQAALKNDVAVIGVTDYMSIDGYERLLFLKRDTAKSAARGHSRQVSERRHRRPYHRLRQGSRRYRGRRARVIAFFGIAFVITALLLRWYSGSWKLTALALICALMPVVWLLGLLPLLGYGIDPLSILVPFLIFSIGVSHAVQMTNAWKLETLRGADAITASRQSFNKLFIPGAMALLANALGFLVLLHIEIAIVQELAITASLGVALMIVTNKVLLPVLLSHIRLSAADASRGSGMATSGDWLWRRLASFAERRVAVVVLLVALVLLASGAWQARELQTGDLGPAMSASWPPPTKPSMPPKSRC